MEIEFSRIVDALPELVWTVHPDGQSEYLNRRWCEYTGLAVNEALGHAWRAVVHPDDIPGYLQAWADAVRLAAAGEIDARLRRSDGEYRWFTVRFAPLSGEEDEAALWCVSAAYSDERSGGEGEGAEGPDSRLRRLVDSMPTQILLMTPSAGLEFVNREVLDYYGKTLDELKQWEGSGAIHPDDLPDVFDRLTGLMQRGEPWDSHSRMLRADGAYRWVRSRMVPSRDAQGNIVRYVSVQADVHDLKQAEDLLAGEIRLLEMVALGRPLDQVLDAVCRFIEGIYPEFICGIYPIDWSGPVFKYGVAPSLPASYIEPIKGWPVAVDKAPCGIAVAEDRQVIVVDVETDPTWRGTEYRDHVVNHGLRSVWSTLIRSQDGHVHGSFCVYQRQPASPTPSHQKLILQATHIASIALDRAQADEALKAREAELRRAHLQLSEAQRLSKTGSFTADLQRDQHDWSEELYRIFEFDPATPPSVQVVRDRVHPDDRPVFDAAIRRGIEGGDTDFTYRAVMPEAGLKYLRCAAQVVEHVAGRPILMGTVQDITESKLAEAALAAQAAELRQAQRYLIEAQHLSKTGSFTWDVQADEHRWSPEIRRIYGFDPGVEITMPMLVDAAHPDDLPEIERVIGGAVDGRDFDLIFRVLTTEREVRYAHVVGHRIEDITDRPVFVGALQDVTESKVAEAELRRANSYLTIAQRLSRTGSFIWDLQKNERQWSEEMYRIFDLDPATAVPSAMTQEMIHPDDLPILESLMQRAREGQDFDGEFRLLMPGGAIKNLHVVGLLLNTDRDRPVFVGAAQDVTELRRGEEALSKARAELAHVARITTLSALTASIAHEVSQPLSGILNNANTCLRMLGAEPPNLDGAADTARRTIRDTNRATEVIKRLRALFGRKPPKMEPVDLNDLARDVIALTSNELHRAQVALRTEFAEDLPPIKGDRVQLQQVILNLLLNAADAMTDVEGRPRTALVQTGLDGERVKLSVQDAGVGVDPQAIEKLFDAFYTTKANGMGVGLAISRSIIESHEGRIWAAANDGPGATFAFAIPCRSGPASGSANRNNSTTSVPSRGEGDAKRNA